ncbi:MAG: hypothetical protein AAB438_03115 [Patescibacteria group bacterium]
MSYDEEEGAVEEDFKMDDELDPLEDAGLDFKFTEEEEDTDPDDRFK